MDVYSAIFPVHIIFKVFGLAPININRGNKVIHCSKNLLIYNICLVLLFSSTFINIYDYLMTVTYYDETYITLLNDCVTLYVQAVGAVVCIVLPIIYRHKYTNIINDLHYTNVIMSNLSMRISYKNIYIYGTALTLLLLFVEIILTTTAYNVIYEKQNYYAILNYIYIFTFPSFTNAAMKSQFETLVIILSININCLNKYLEDLIVLSKFSACEGIILNKIQNSRNGRDLITTISKIYDTFVKNAQILNEIFSLQMLLFLVYDFVVILDNSYYFIYIQVTSHNEEGNKLLLSAIVICFIWDSTRLCITVFICTNFNHQVSH
ncbi:hypothetical protein L9F63_002815, partial [Diploptera punctata]